MTTPPRPVLLNTAAAHFFHAIGQLPLLAEMYGTVLVPPAAARELGKGAAPLAVLELPFVRLALPVVGDVRGQGRASLGASTEEALAIARRLERPLLILEGRGHRQAARDLGLEATGVLGVLLKARQDGRISSVKDHFAGLEEAGFALSPKLAGGVLLLSGEL